MSHTPEELSTEELPTKEEYIPLYEEEYFPSKIGGAIIGGFLGLVCRGGVSNG